jgi:hypothetical protein
MVILSIKDFEPMLVLSGGDRARSIAINSRDIKIETALKAVILQLR